MFVGQRWSGAANLCLLSTTRQSHDGHSSLSDCHRADLSLSLSLWGLRRIGLFSSAMTCKLANSSDPPSPLSSDKLSRLALPSELIECHYPRGIRRLAEGGCLAPILRGRLATFRFQAILYKAISSCPHPPAEGGR